MKKTKTISNNSLGHSLVDFCKALKQKKNILLASHMNPEGDAIGSVLALDSLLRRLGKKTTVACQDAFPDRLRCLPSDRWNRTQDIPAGRKFDALVVADCPSIDRIGSVRDLIGSETEIFNIDHHVTNTQFGHYNYIHPKAAACGEVVYDIFKHFKMKINKEEAAALYVSITTDTGSFKYSNATVKSHQVASELIQTGIDTEKISDELYATYSLEKIQLYSLLLAKVHTDRRGTIAWAELTCDDLKRSGGTYEDSEGFIDFLKYLREVQFAFLLTELDASPPGKVRISFRSKGSYDVAKIATYFGGGGHRKAAGCSVTGSLRDVAQKVLERIYDALENQNSKETA